MLVITVVAVHCIPGTLLVLQLLRSVCALLGSVVADFFVKSALVLLLCIRYILLVLRL